jgi:hypothetical protein
MSAMLQSRLANNPPRPSSRNRLAEPARMLFAAIAAFLQSLLNLVKLPGVTRSNLDYHAP